MKTTTAGFLLIGILLWQAAAGAALGPQGIYTEQNPKYQQRPRTNSLSAESLRTLEASVLRDFRRYAGRCSAPPRAVVRVNAQELAAKNGADELRNSLNEMDLAAELQQTLRRAGFVVVDSEAADLKCVLVDVRLSARTVTIHEILGVEVKWLPEIQVKAKTSWDSRIVGQTQSLQFLGNTAQAHRILERIGTQNLLRALSIMLLYDLACNNAIEAPLTVIQAIAQNDQPDPSHGFDAPKPPALAEPKPHPQNDLSTNVSMNKVDTPGGYSLFRLTDRSKALQQVVDALKAGKT